MELTWWAVLIAGCLSLAGCITAVLIQPPDTEGRRFRLLANVDRLTRLPAYRRAARLRTISAVVAISLLITAFATATVTAARPTGLPSATQKSVGLQPEDIMVCVGGPGADPAVDAALRYFGERVKTFSTQRIGLTSANRRVIPLTRDYQYASAQFSDQVGATTLASAVSYLDYAGGVEDVLAMCLTGFPSFTTKAAQRRSLIYIGPAALRAQDETRPALFTADGVLDLARTAGVQINALVTGPGGAMLQKLVDETDGLSFPGTSGVATHLAEIRDHPPRPAPAEADAAAVRFRETPDVPVLIALLALTALAWWPIVVRR